MTDYEEELQFVLPLLEACGREALRFQAGGARVLAVRHKPMGGGPITEADRTLNERIVSAIGERFPTTGSSPRRAPTPTPRRGETPSAAGTWIRSTVRGSSPAAPRDGRCRWACVSPGDRSSASSPNRAAAGRAGRRGRIDGAALSCTTTGARAACRSRGDPVGDPVDRGEAVPVLPPAGDPPRARGRA